MYQIFIQMYQIFIQMYYCTKLSSKCTKSSFKCTQIWACTFGGDYVLRINSHARWGLLQATLVLNAVFGWHLLSVSYPPCLMILHWLSRPHSVSDWRRTRFESNKPLTDQLRLGWSHNWPPSWGLWAESAGRRAPWMSAGWCWASEPWWWRSSGLPPAGESLQDCWRWPLHSGTPTAVCTGRTQVTFNTHTSHFQHACKSLLTHTCHFQHTHKSLSTHTHVTFNTHTSHFQHAHKSLSTCTQVIFNMHF